MHRYVHRTMKEISKSPHVPPVVSNQTLKVQNLVLVMSWPFAPEPSANSAEPSSVWGAGGEGRVSAGGLAVVLRLRVLGIGSLSLKFNYSLNCS